jgi:hypothetical protein
MRRQQRGAHHVRLPAFNFDPANFGFALEFFKVQRLNSEVQPERSATHACNIEFESLKYDLRAWRIEVQPQNSEVQSLNSEFLLLIFTVQVSLSRKCCAMAPADFDCNSRS